MIGLQVETSTTVVGEVEPGARPSLADVAAHLVAVEVVRPLGHLRREHAGDEAGRDRGGPDGRRLGVLSVERGEDAARAERGGGEAAETEERVAAREPRLVPVVCIVASCSSLLSRRPRAQGDRHGVLLAVPEIVHDDAVSRLVRVDRCLQLGRRRDRLAVDRSDDVADLSPAAAAGVSVRTSSSVAPAVPVDWPTETPRYACWTLPSSTICATIDFTVFDGIAKPTPSLPPDSLSICALTPMTFPSRSSSGPPELPWLIAASVWTAPLIV